MNILQVTNELLPESPMIDIHLNEMGMFCASNRQLLCDKETSCPPGQADRQGSDGFWRVGTAATADVLQS